MKNCSNIVELIFNVDYKLGRNNDLALNPNAYNSEWDTFSNVKDNYKLHNSGSNFKNTEVKFDNWGYLAFN